MQGLASLAPRKETLPFDLSSLRSDYLSLPLKALLIGLSARGRDNLNGTSLAYFCFDGHARSVPNSILGPSGGLDPLKL